MQRILNHIFLMLLVSSVKAQTATTNYQFQKLDCSVSLKNDTLIVENSEIKRTWFWNRGDVISTNLKNLKSQQNFKLLNDKPDLQLQTENAKASNANIFAEWVENSRQYTQHLKITLSYNLGSLQVKKILKLYQNFPAISTELYLKGNVKGDWFSGINNDNVAKLKNFEETPIATANQLPIAEQLFFPGKHHKIKSIEFLMLQILTIH